VTWSTRRLAAALFLLAVVIGTVSNPRGGRVPPRVGDYWLLAGDFHVHAFPGDGSLVPWLLRDAAAHAGLDVIAVTNHNQVFTARFGQWLARFSAGPLVIAGQEITNPDYHLAAIGLDRSVNADQPAAAAIAEVHAQGGVVIAAHPTRDYQGFDDAAVASLDGTELAHPAMDASDNERQDFAAFFARARRLNPQVSPIGSSDFHVTPAIGQCRTYLLAREHSAAGVLEAIRSGRTVAVDANRRLYGDPKLIELIERSAPMERVETPDTWRRLAVALAWIALSVMLVIGKAQSR